MLQSLAGKQHEVFTAISLIHAGSHAVRSERTSVFMSPLTPQQIDQYLSTNLWSDKAGGYAIQNTVSLLVQRIDGCFYNVVGLPISLLHSMLLAHGIDMWTFV